MSDIVEALKSYKQADQDGVMVTVSRQACDEAAAELTRLRARVEELEKALKPFADANKRLAPYEMDGLHPAFTATYGDFRAAARAMRKK